MAAGVTEQHDAFFPPKSRRLAGVFFFIQRSLIVQLVVTSEDLQAAPSNVRDWLIGRLAPVSAERAKESKASNKQVKQSTETPTTTPPTMKEIMDKAVSLIESKGEDTLAEILKKIGVERVKECPEEKRADLLAEIAIHV
jgi:hypothetical protein